MSNQWLLLIASVIASGQNIHKLPHMNGTKIHTLSIQMNAGLLSLLKPMSKTWELKNEVHCPVLVPWQSCFSWWQWSGTPRILVCGTSDRLGVPCPLPLQTAAQWRTADCLAALCGQEHLVPTPSAEWYVHVTIMIYTWWPVRNYSWKRWMSNPWC